MKHIPIKQNKIINMNKSDLINAIAESTGLTKADSNRVIDAFVGAVQKTLSKGEKVTLVGFGTFETSKREARKGRNPKTGAVIQIPARKVAKFRAGSKLAESVNS
jgi:DNA-binding protein HU-beta